MVQLLLHVCYHLKHEALAECAAISSLSPIPMFFREKPGWEVTLYSIWLCEIYQLFVSVHFLIINGGVMTRYSTALLSLMVEG